MPVLLGGNPGEPPPPSEACSAQRERFVIGPGPDAGGSNQGKTGCVHVPVKSGTEAFPAVPPDLPSANCDCASTGIATIATTVILRMIVRCSGMTPPLVLRISQFYLDSTGRFAALNNTE